MMQNLPAMGPVTDIGELRPVFYQSGRLVHGPYGMQLQPLDADLTAIAALSGTGIATRTGSGTWATRTITGTTNEIIVTNGNGVSGNPTLVLSGSIGAAKAFRRGNILGTVSQSSGVPTGELIERGSNANGEYVRFADGTQICTHKPTLEFLTLALLNVVWTFPAAFVAAPIVTHNISPSTAVGYATSPNDRGKWGSPMALPVSTGSTSYNIQIARVHGQTDFVSGNTVQTHAVAIGRWF